MWFVDMDVLYVSGLTSLPLSQEDVAWPKSVKRYVGLPFQLGLSATVF